MKHNSIALFLVFAVTTAPLQLLGCGWCSDNRPGISLAATSTSADLSTPDLPNRDQNGTGRSNETGAASPVITQDRLRDLTPVEPPQKKLSGDAQATYAFLVLTRAIIEEDDSLLLEVAKLPGKTLLPPNIWIDAIVASIGKKSKATIPLLEAARTAWPEDLSLILLEAEALMESGMTQKGIASLREYLKRHPDTLDAKLELALLLVRNKEFTEAEILLNTITAKERTPMVSYYHARALIGMGRKAEAIGHLQKTVKAMPEFVEAQAELAFLYEQKASWREARDIYDKLAKLNPGNKDIILKLIHISLRQKRPDRAQYYLRQGPDSTDFRITAAGLFLEAGHFQVAERQLMQLSTLPDPPDEVWLLLAELAYAHKKDVKRSLAWLDRIGGNSKFAVQSRIMRGQILAESGQMDRAIADVRESRKKHPDEPGLCELEVRILAKAQKLPQAIEVARAGNGQWPENEGLAFLLGSMLDESGDKKAALAVMEKILVANPDNHHALNYVGYSLAEENRDLERALKLLVRADQLAPNQSYIVDSLAWALFKSGKTEQAMAEIRRAVSLGVHIDPSIWEHYGDIARKLGLREEARKGYRNAIEMKPDNVEDLRKRLSQL